MVDNLRTLPTWATEFARKALGILLPRRLKVPDVYPSEQGFGMVIISCCAMVALQGFGVLDKTILVFDKLFWNSTDFISRNMVDRSGLWSVFLNYNKTLGLPVLVALNPADTARQLESMTDDEVVASLIAFLRRMYGAAIPQPRQAFVTRWCGLEMRSAGHS